MTNQEIYDKVKAHLLAQNKKAINGDICAYRGQDGTKCAVGCLILDEQYYPNLEGHGPWSMDVNDALTKSIGTHDPSFLTALQELHDNNSPDAWCTQLELFATRYGLEP